MKEVEINYVHDVYPIEYNEALQYLFRRFNLCGDAIMKTSLCLRLQQICDPVFRKLESFTGFGGNLGSNKGGRHNGNKSENLDLTMGTILEDGQEPEEDEEKSLMWASTGTNS